MKICQLIGRSVERGGVFPLFLVPIPLNNSVFPKLNQVHHNHKYDNGKPGDIQLISVVSVHDGVISQATRSDGTSHGSKTNQAHRSYRRSPHNRSNAFLQIHAENNVKGRKSHAFGGFNQSVVNFGKGSLNLSAEKRHRPENQGL